MTSDSPIQLPMSPGEKWSEQLDAYGKTYKPWLRRMDKVVQRYRDERDTLENTGDVFVENWTSAKYNVLYSNTSVLQPAIYNHTPQPVVSRRYADKDPVGRTASEILQRCISITLEDGFDDTMMAARDDYLFGGRGTTWCRYEPKFGDEPLMMPQADEAGELIEVEVLDDDGKPVFPLTGEYACADYVEAKDFAHTPVRKWKDVTWVARRHYFTKKEAADVVGEKAAKGLKYVEHSTKPVSTETTKQTGFLDGQKKAEIWEIWDKVSKKVLFWSESKKEQILKEANPPIDFQHFFPCPKPCYGITTNGSLVPVPYYVEYQDQARELDNLTARMDNLLGACKVAGLYDSSLSADIKAMMQSFELTMTPVDNMSAKYQEKGKNNGLDAMVKFFPVEQFAKVYDQLRMAREQVKRDCDEITGISDIVRGYSSPNATATAEQIKSNYATLRLDKMKQEVARFARDTIRLLAEIISEGFTPETIMDMAGVEFMDEQSKMLAPQAIELLKNDKQRTFRVDIETDSTVALDETEEKQDRLEFLETMAKFLEGALQIGSQAPELAPLLKESIMFAVRSFKAGRSMEANFEQALDAMLQKTKEQAAAGPPPDPKMIEAQQNAQLKQQEAAQNAQLQQQKAAQDAQLATQKAQQDMQVAKVKAAADIQAKQIEVNADILASEREAMAKIAMEERVAMAKIESEERVNAIRAKNEAAKSQDYNRSSGAFAN